MIIDAGSNKPPPPMSSNLDILSSLKCQIVKAQLRSKTGEGNEGSVGGASPTRKAWGFSGKQTNAVGVLATEGSPTTAQHQPSQEYTQPVPSDAQANAVIEDINTADWEITPDELTLAAVLGEGEFGIVYKGKWNGTPVAIKVVKASEKLNQQQLAAEVGVLRRIHHPNIVQFLGACTRSKPVTIVSEVMEGGSLADALQLRPQPPLRRALEIALDCTRGLNYLHLANPHAIIHRDLKPSNIMLTKPGPGVVDPLLHTSVAKLADFGLSKNITPFLPVPVGCERCAYTSPTGSPPRATDVQLAPHGGGCGDCGSPGGGQSGIADKTVLVERMFKMTGGTGSHVFMAGEIFRREPYNAKADVYSLAMVMYEMLSGRGPFAEMDAREAVLRAARDGLRPQWPPAPEGLSAAEFSVLRGTQALVQRCWAADATARPACSEIIPRLETLIDQLPRDQYPSRTTSSDQLSRLRPTTGRSGSITRHRGPEATTTKSPKRGWSKIKGWGSAISLRKSSTRDGSNSTCVSQQHSMEGVAAGKVLVGAGGEGTHVGGRPRAGSADSLRQLDTAASSQRGVRVGDAAARLHGRSTGTSQRDAPYPHTAPISAPLPSPLPTRLTTASSADSQGFLSMLRKLSRSAEARGAKSRQRSASRGLRDEVGEGGICRSIAEVEQR